MTRLRADQIEQAGIKMSALEIKAFSELIRDVLSEQQDKANNKESNNQKSIRHILHGKTTTPLVKKHIDGDKTGNVTSIAYSRSAIKIILDITSVEELDEFVRGCGLSEDDAKNCYLNHGGTDTLEISRVLAYGVYAQHFIELQKHGKLNAEDEPNLVMAKGLFSLFARIEAFYYGAYYALKLHNNVKVKIKRGRREAVSVKPFVIGRNLVNGPFVPPADGDVDDNIIVLPNVVDDESAQSA